MSNDTKQQPICPQGQANEAVKGDNPLSKQYSLLEVMVFFHNRRALMNTYGIKGECLETLVEISNRWVYEGLSSSVYWLARNTKSSYAMTFTKRKIIHLLSKGLIEIVGTGKSRSGLYAPTSHGLSALGCYFSCSRTA